MQFSELSTVKHRVVLGAPLPFNVRDADHTLLLARGKVIASAEQMQALFRRGALVDLNELMSATDRVRLAPKEKLPGLWRQCFDSIGDTLMLAGQDNFQMALESSVAPVLGLLARDPDLAIFQVLRQDANEFTRYGMDHSLHAGIAAQLMARRLGWNEAESERAFKAALTMNISMLELQGQLASQHDPMTPEQGEAVKAHPEFSVRMLELAGITDRDWLEAVACHHESADGSGYPAGARQVSELGAMLHRADLYAAKLSPRVGRPALAADVAVREMFSVDASHPMTAALVKEFGIYPPGCFVRLINGEAGVVIQRGPSVTTPRVAVLRDAHGRSLPGPMRRDTAVKAHAVHSVMPALPEFSMVRSEALVALTD